MCDANILVGLRFEIPFFYRFIVAFKLEDVLENDIKFVPFFRSYNEIKKEKEEGDSTTTCNLEEGDSTTICNLFNNTRYTNLCIKIYTKFRYFMLFN